MAEGGVSRDGVVAGPLSLEEQLSKFPTDLLDSPCVESHLGKLVHVIDTETMVMMATHLELLAVEVDDIQTAWPRKPAIQRLEMFKRWQEKKILQATYRYGCEYQINILSQVLGFSYTNVDSSIHIYIVCVVGYRSDIVHN